MKISLKDTKLTLSQIVGALRILADMAEHCESVEAFQHYIKIVAETYEG